MTYHTARVIPIHNQPGSTGPGLFVEIQRTTSLKPPDQPTTSNKREVNLASTISSQSNHICNICTACTAINCGKTTTFPFNPPYFFCMNPRRFSPTSLVPMTSTNGQPAKLNIKTHIGAAAHAPEAGDFSNRNSGFKQQNHAKILGWWFYIIDFSNWNGILKNTTDYCNKKKHIGIIKYQ